MPQDNGFEMQEFLPYLLNRAAEEVSLDFQTYYKRRYGMLRTEWRVLFHLGRYGNLTASEIGQRARIHKTKISRAVSALEGRRFLAREKMEQDRRQELLSLTSAGKAAYDDLSAISLKYNEKIRARFTSEEWETLSDCLTRLASA